MGKDLSHLRETYGERGVDRADLADDPFTQFGRWFEEWRATDPYDATAVALAAAGGEGRPSVRNVLVKGVDHGFVFFTNYQSAKGAELAANPQAALCFGWLDVERQVRVVGPVEQVSVEESDAYFSSRPRGSQVAAVASDQSRVVADRSELERRWAEVEARHPGEVPRPAHWGGYRLVPDELEFWQGRRNRLHDRFRYRRADPIEAGRAWVIERLAP